MPKRPRTARVEGESHRAFEQALGEFFVYRREAPDVGVDGVVEIFVGDDTTGLSFDVQVRATDSQDEEEARRVRLELKQVAYWRSRVGPTLVVRYLAASARIYVRWLHSFDPYYDGEPAGKSLALPMRNEDEFTSERRERLRREVVAWRELQLSAVRLPMPFRVSAEGSTFSQVELLLALRGHNSTPDALQLETPPGAPGDLRFVVTEDELRVDLAGVTGASSHVDTDAELGLDTVARELLAQTSLALERVGQAHIAGRLAHAYLAGSLLAAQGEAVTALASCMAQARQVREALELSEQLDELEDHADPENDKVQDIHDNSQMLTVVAAVHARALTPSESEERLVVLRRRVRRRHEGRDTIGAARESVSLANALTGAGQHGRALAELERALKLDPCYDGRAHWHQERGAALLGAHRYEEAASAWERAFELAGRPIDRALKADALMGAGRFEEAHAEFSRYARTGDDLLESSTYLQKFKLCDLLLANGIRRQDRRIERAVKLADRAAQADDRQTSIDLAMRALEADGLCGLAWFNLAISLREGRMEGAPEAWSAAAVTNAWDPDTWAEAVLTCDEDSVGPLLLAARTATRGAVFASLARWARENDLLEALDRLPALMQGLPPEPVASVSLRAISDEGVETIELPSVPPALRRRPDRSG